MAPDVLCELDQLRRMPDWPNIREIATRETAFFLYLKIVPHTLKRLLIQVKYDILVTKKGFHLEVMVESGGMW